MEKSSWEEVVKERPWILDRPKEKDLLEKWQQTWSSIILKWSEECKPYGFFLNEALHEPLLSRLGSENLSMIMDYMVKKSDASYLNPEGTRFFVHWRTTEEWSELVYNWMKGSAVVERPIGVLQVTSADEEFSQLPEDILRRILLKLVESGKAEWWPGKKGSYVRVKIPGVTLRRERRPRLATITKQRSDLDVVGDCQQERDRLTIQSNSLNKSIEELELEVLKLMATHEEETIAKAKGKIREMQELKVLVGQLDDRIKTLDATITSILISGTDYALKKSIDKAVTTLESVGKISEKLEETTPKLREAMIRIDAMKAIFKDFRVSTDISDKEVEKEFDKLLSKTKGARSTQEQKR